MFQLSKVTMSSIRNIIQTMHLCFFHNHRLQMLKQVMTLVHLHIVQTLACSPFM